MALAEELLKRVCADPDDVDARRVYADFLQDQGDPRGTYVAQHCALSELDVLSPEYPALLASVRRQMMSRPIGFPTLTELADRRHVSPRTLKRQLAAHGTSFQHLLDELRRDRALALLEDDGIAIDRIAELLGYADPSNFNRAFRRWMGTSPSEWRAKRG